MVVLPRAKSIKANKKTQLYKAVFFVLFNLFAF